MEPLGRNALRHTGHQSTVHGAHRSSNNQRDADHQTAGANGAQDAPNQGVEAGQNGEHFPESDLVDRERTRGRSPTSAEVIRNLKAHTENGRGRIEAVAPTATRCAHHHRQHIARAPPPTELPSRRRPKSTAHHLSSATPASMGMPHAEIRQIANKHSVYWTCRRVHAR